MKKQHLIIGIASALGAIVVAGLLWWQFGTNPLGWAPTVSKTSGLTMKVAKYYWPGEYWVEIADQKGWFKEAGLNVTLVDTNPDYFASLQDVADGRLDTQEFVLFDLVKHLNEGADLVAVLAGDRSLGADGIVAKKEIKSTAELRGKKVGLPVGTYLDFILDTVIEQHGFHYRDVTEVDIVAEKLAEEFAKGTLDAVVTYEPYLSQAVEKGKGHKIFDTSELPGVSVGVYAFRRDFVEQRPDDVQRFVAVWSRTTDYIKTNPDEAFSIIAKNYGVTKEDVKSFADLDKILDRRDNTTAFSYAAGLESFHGLARHIVDFLREEKLLEKNIDSTTFLDPRFIRALSQ